MRSPFWISLTAILAVSSLPAGAADAWDAPAFSVPARDLLEAASAVKREQVTAVVVLLDERTFVLDEQHRLTSISRLIYRIDSPDGVERWAASTAHWQPWHQARPAIRARVITTDGREHQIDQNLLSESGTRRPAASRSGVCGQCPHKPGAWAQGGEPGAREPGVPGRCVRPRLARESGSGRGHACEAAGRGFGGRGVG